MEKTKQLKFVQLMGCSYGIYGLTKEGKVYLRYTQTDCKPGQGTGGGNNVPCDEIRGWKALSMNELV